MLALLRSHMGIYLKSIHSNDFFEIFIQPTKYLHTYLLTTDDMGLIPFEKRPNIPK